MHHKVDGPGRVGLRVYRVGDLLEPPLEVAGGSAVGAGKGAQHAGPAGGNDHGGT